jgi:hypothetical protein
MGAAAVTLLFVSKVSDDLNIVYNKTMKDYHSMPLNSWWHLPETAQKAIAALVPKRSKWTLNCKRHEFDVWTFSLPQFLTYEESLCNGTEIVMDKWFERLTGEKPETGSAMAMTVSSEPLEDYTTLIDFKRDDVDWAGSTIYRDTVLDLPIWLCPYLQILFKGKPDQIWVKFTPLG